MLSQQMTKLATLRRRLFVYLCVERKSAQKKLNKQNKYVQNHNRRNETYIGGYKSRTTTKVVSKLQKNTQEIPVKNSFVSP